jgi:hypothetical protein
MVQTRCERRQLPHGFLVFHGAALFLRVAAYMLGSNLELLLQAREMVGREPSSSALIQRSDSQF